MIASQDKNKSCKITSFFERKRKQTTMHTRDKKLPLRILMALARPRITASIIVAETFNEFIKLMLVGMVVKCSPTMLLGYKTAMKSNFVYD